VTDQAGKVVQYTYDAANQLQSVIQTAHPDPSHNTTLYGYDPNGNLSTLTDANTHTTQNAFDQLSQLQTETMPAGQTQTRTYDYAGNLTSLIDYNGHKTTYTYDSLNRLSTVVDNNLSVGQNTTQYTYDPASNVATVTYPNGLSSTFQYDDLNRLKLLNGYQYQLGPTGNRIGATEPSGRTLNWTYDGGSSKLSHEARCEVRMADDRSLLAGNATTLGANFNSSVAIFCGRPPRRTDPQGCERRYALAGEAGDGASIRLEAIRLHAAADQVYRWCRPPIRGNANTWAAAMGWDWGERATGVSFLSPICVRS
jgi:YD repeat-containing protein